MHDIRDLISGSLHVERVVFSSEVTHRSHEPENREERRTHFYIGAMSGDRFLLLEIPSPESANDAVDRRRIPRGQIIARTSNSDFTLCGPLIAPQPRSAATPEFERALPVLLNPLYDCLRLGIYQIKPGTLRWDGDNFRAEYSDSHRNLYTNGAIRFGDNVPESVKEKYLADLLSREQNPSQQRVGGSVGHSTHRRSLGSASPEIPKPPPGSVEARILAYRAARHEAEMVKGIAGQLLRDAGGKVFEIRCEAQGYHRIELEYASSADLPLPFPHLIKRTRADAAQFNPPIAPWLMTIYSLRGSDQSPDDSVFVPWNYLKEGTYVKGKALPNPPDDPEFVGPRHPRSRSNFRYTLADPKDHKLWRELIEQQDRN